MTADNRTAPAIFYVGPQVHGSTTVARRAALESLGCRLAVFDTAPHMARGNWLLRQLSHRLARGPNLAALNRDLMTVGDELPAGDWMVWVDKGIWIYPETLAALRDRLGATLVHYTPDPQIIYQPERLHHFLAGIPLYDVLFTTKPFEVDAYRQRGARQLRLVHQSYNDARIGPRTLTAADRERLGAEVLFIGQYTDHYARLLKAALGTGARVRLWGPNWRKRLWRLPAIRPVFCGDGVWGDDYVLALNAAEIALCFLSKRYAETTTTRTFEIPGAGAFMLAERTAHHLDLYQEDVEAAFFGDTDELADKIRYYRSRPDERARIAAAGHARALRSGYGDRARMQSLLTTALSIRDAAATPPGAAHPG